jgi:hypothetical protein
MDLSFLGTEKSHAPAKDPSLLRIRALSAGVPLVAICCSNWVTRACMNECLGEEELQFLLSEATRKLFHDVDSLSARRVFDSEHVGSENFNILLHLH